MRSCNSRIWLLSRQATALTFGMSVEKRVQRGKGARQASDARVPTDQELLLNQSICIFHVVFITSRVRFPLRF